MTISKSALVTGAAGGIGQMLTTNLIELGHHVFMLDISEAGLQRCKEKFGAGVTTIICDVTSNQSVTNAFATISKAISKLDVLINNAGYIVPGPFQQVPLEAIEKQIDINLMGPLRILNVFLPLMSAPANIVNIVSMAGILPLKDNAPYTAGKFGLRGATATLSQELNPRGIKVSGIYPSSVDTPMLLKETRSGGSPLNFIAEPLKPKQVADLAMRAIREGKLEYYLPYSDGVLSRICNVMPWIIPLLMPHFEKKGIAGKERYLERNKDVV